MPRIPARPWVQSGVSQGLSANQAYRQYQQTARDMSAETGERWSGMRRGSFLALYSETRALRAQLPEAVVAPFDQPGGGLTPVERSTIRAEGIGNWGALFVRQAGQTFPEHFYYFQRTQEPLTPQELEDRARADFEASSAAKHGTLEGYKFVSFVFTGVERLIPRGG